MPAGRCCGGRSASAQAVRANNNVSRKDAQFHAWRTNFVTYVKGHLVECGLASGAMGPRIRKDLGHPSGLKREASGSTLMIESPATGESRIKAKEALK